RGLSDQTDAKTEASKPPTTSSVAEPATETEAKRINAAVINGRRTSAVPSMKPGCKEVAPERMSKMNQEVEDNAVNELNSELKELLQEARLSEERYNCIKRELAFIWAETRCRLAPLLVEIDTLRDLNRSRSGLIAEAKRLVHSLREELLDKEISLRQLQNEKEQLELDLRLVDDDARFFEEELTRLQTRVERAQAEADATFIREEMANLEAGGGDEDDDEYGDASEEEDEDDDEDENEDKDKEEDNDDDDDDEYDECEENSSEEEEIDNYECDEDNSSSDLAGNSGIAARKNLEQFLEMMMELEQLKLEAQAADELNQLAEARTRLLYGDRKLAFPSGFVSPSMLKRSVLRQALEKDESVRLNVFEKKLKHHNERHNENDGTKDK
ncbi:conserved hypothetical protein, partial [Perkinsus marinus ATCC 50983]